MRDVWQLFESWRSYQRDPYSVGTDPLWGPPPLINDVVDCWASEGIMFYNELHHANGMAYHVMLPTEELEFHIERKVAPHQFSTLSQQLVDEGGPTHAVRIAVGKNGRAIIDQDADIVMAAKQVGLSELPVLFNFQNEV